MKPTNQYARNVVLINVISFLLKWPRGRRDCFTAIAGWTNNHFTRAALADGRYIGFSAQ